MVAVPLGVMDPGQRGMRPAYVQFLKKPREDRNASIQAGSIVEFFEDIVLINPPGSKDRVERDVKGWLENLALQVKDRMLPPEIADYYRETYRRWKEGQEMPPNGTPILGWQLLSNTDQQRVIGSNILTVEDLAEASFEHLQSIGMGSMAMATKAKNWIAVGRDKGSVALQLQAIQEKNDQLTRQVEALLAAQAEKAATKPTERQPHAVSDVPNSTIPDIYDAINSGLSEDEPS